MKNKAAAPQKNKIELMKESITYTKYFDNCLAVFQGGGCKAIAYVGAFESAYKRGVIFNELAGTSAGALIAAMIAAGAKPDDLKQLVDELFVQRRTTFKMHKWGAWIPMGIIVLLSLPIWVILLCVIPKYVHRILAFPILALLRKNGFYSMSSLQDIIEEKLHQFTGIEGTDPIHFRDINPNLHIVAANIEANTEMIWNKHNTPNDSVAEAVCASCAYPFYFQPIKGKYVDGGLLSNTPNHIFAKHATYNRILSFQLISERNDKPGFIGHLKRVMDTIVDGAVSIQESLGNQANYNIPIDLKMSLSAIDFDSINKNVVRNLIKRGYEATELFFNNNDVSGRVPTYLGVKSNRTIDAVEKMYALIASYSRDTQIAKVYISVQDTTWVWVLFPTILRWRRKNTKVVVYVPKNLQNRNTTLEKEEARRRLLKALKCDLIIEEQQNTILGFFAEDIKSNWCGVAYSEKESETDNTIMVFNKGYYYDGPLESLVIHNWVEKLRNKREPDWNRKKTRLKIQQAPHNLIINTLRKIDTYTNAQISFQEIEYKSLRFISNYVRLEKYRQIDVLFDLYKEAGLDLFEPATILLGNKFESIITPIIIEKHNGQLFVIEGKTRVKYAYHHGYEHLHAFVIEDVAKPLPINETFTPPTLEHVMVTDDKSPENLNCMHLFRHIEETFHPSATFLLKGKFDEISE